VSETLWNMRGRVRDLKPNIPESVANGLINKRIRNVCEKRNWADLLRLGTISIPPVYNTGLVSNTRGSLQVTGAGTLWPTNDAVNTTLVNPITDIGYNEDIEVASMTGLQAGQFVVIGIEDPGTSEVVALTHTCLNDSTVTAKVQKTHDAGSSVVASSLAGLQIRIQNYVFTVQAVLSDSTLLLDRPWGDATTAGQSYIIYLAYATVTPDTKRMLYAFDPTQGNPLDVTRTSEWLSVMDPQRLSTGDPLALVMMPPNTGGVQQWEIWPYQTSGRMLNVVTYERWPKLKANEDISPWFINEEIFIAGAVADAYRTPVIQSNGKTDPFFQPGVADNYEQQYKELVEDAEQRDEGRYMQSLKNWIDQANALQYPGANFERSHPGWPQGE